MPFPVPAPPLPPEPPPIPAPPLLPVLVLPEGVLVVAGGVVTGGGVGVLVDVELLLVDCVFAAVVVVGVVLVGVVLVVVFVAVLVTFRQSLAASWPTVLAPWLRLLRSVALIDPGRAASWLLKLLTAPWACPHCPALTAAEA